MIEETTMRAIADTTYEENAPSFVYYELADGRMVPVEMGGLVELALFELGGQIVDVVEQPARSPILGLN
jgi:hypothetical protein